MLNDTLEVLKPTIKVIVEDFFVDWFLDHYKFLTDYVNKLWINPDEEIDPYGERTEFGNPIDYEITFINSVKDILGWDLTPIPEKIRNLLKEDYLKDISDEEIEKTVKMLDNDEKFWKYINGLFWDEISRVVKRNPQEYVYNWEGLKDKIKEGIKLLNTELFDLEKGYVRWIYYDFVENEIGITEKFKEGSKSYREILGGSFYVIFLMEVESQDEITPEEYKEFLTSQDIINEMIEHLKEV